MAPDRFEIYGGAMSVVVPIEELAVAIQQQIGWCYLLTVSATAHARVLAIAPTWSPDSASLHALVGQRTADNLAARPDVSMVWPPAAVDGYTLIADGVATVDGLNLTFQPTSAVLHRSAVTRS